MAEIIVSKYMEIPVVTAFIDGRLEYLSFVRERELNNIYVGKVEHIVKNIDAAFIRYHDNNIGYLSLRKIMPCCVLNRQFISGAQLKCGDEIIVQVEAEPIKTKKAKLTTNISISSANAAVTIGKIGVGASLKLSDEVRKMLTAEVKDDFNQLSRRYSDTLESSNLGMIIRTAAADLPRENARDIILSEAQECISKILDVISTGRTRTAGSILYDNYRDDMLSSVIENAKAFLKTKDIFDSRIIEDTGIHGITSKIEELKKRKVWLKSGAYIIIEQLESFNAIDVNTGKAISGKKSIAEEVNLEACEEIMRQIRLRNLSGMILIDFINMDDKHKYEKLISYISKLARKEMVHTSVIDITGLGIMELTRNKADRSLKEILCDIENTVDIEEYQ